MRGRGAEPPSAWWAGRELHVPASGAVAAGLIYGFVERGARGGSPRAGPALSPRRGFPPTPGQRAAVPAAGAAGLAPGVRQREPAAAGALGDAQGIMRELLITQGLPRYLQASRCYLFVRRTVDAGPSNCAAFAAFVSKPSRPGLGVSVWLGEALCLPTHTTVRPLCSFPRRCKTFVVCLFFFAEKAGLQTTASFESVYFKNHY